MLAAASSATRSEYSTIVAPSSPAANFLAAATNLIMEVSPVHVRQGTLGYRMGKCSIDRRRVAVDPDNHRSLCEHAEDAALVPLAGRRPGIVKKTFENHVNSEPTII